MTYKSKALSKKANGNISFVDELGFDFFKYPQSKNFKNVWVLADLSPSKEGKIQILVKS